MCFVQLFPIVLDVMCVCALEKESVWVWLNALHSIVQHTHCNPNEKQQARERKQAREREQALWCTMQAFIITMLFFLLLLTLSFHCSFDNFFFLSHLFTDILSTSSLAISLSSARAPILIHYLVQYCSGFLLLKANQLSMFAFNAPVSQINHSRFIYYYYGHFTCKYIRIFNTFFQLNSILFGG